MVYGIFPEGFAQGTGLSRGHANFLDQMNQILAGGHPGMGVSKRLLNKIIYVDPVDGDDHAANDGTTTPLQTLDALVRRMPAHMDATDPTVQSGGKPIIQLLPGQHVLERNLYLHLPEGIAVRGSYSTIATFELTSYSGDNLVLNKDGGTPAWTPGEFDEMFFALQAFGGVTLIPIITNGDHWIKLAWDWSYWSAYVPSPGAMVEIIDLTSKIVGSSAQLTLDVGSGVSIAYVDFEPFLTVVTGIRANISSCRFSNGYLGIASLGNIFNDHCLFRDFNIGLQPANKTNIRGCYFVRCVDAVQLSFDAFLSIGIEVSFFKDCTRAIADPPSSFSGAKVHYDIPEIYAENVPTFFRFNRGKVSLGITQVLTDIDGKLPDKLFDVKNGASIQLPSTTYEAGTTTFTVNGVTSTMANFFAGGGHNGWWTDTNGNRVFARS